MSAFPVSEYVDRLQAEAGMVDRGVFNLIFVRSIQKGGIEHFQRIGIGRVYRQDFEKEFDLAPERDILLC
jgi:hypothetical protein